MVRLTEVQFTVKLGHLPWRATPVRCEASEGRGAGLLPLTVYDLAHQSDSLSEAIFSAANGQCNTLHGLALHPTTAQPAKDTSPLGSDVIQMCMFSRACNSDWLNGPGVLDVSGARHAVHTRRRS